MKQHWHLKAARARPKKALHSATTPCPELNQGSLRQFIVNANAVSASSIILNQGRLHGRWWLGRRMVLDPSMDGHGVIVSKSMRLVVNPARIKDPS